jgi:molybdopterin synthase sulfur carrier subunit
LAQDPRLIRTPASGSTDEFSTARPSNNQDMTMTGTGSSAGAAPAHGAAVLCLHGPLRKLAGDQARHELAGRTVVELIRALESRHPEIVGWILDERGQIRRHINVFVAGERAAEESPVAPGDRVEVLPAITGGSR